MMVTCLGLIKWKSIGCTRVVRLRNFLLEMLLLMFTSVEQVESTYQGQADKPKRKVELGLKALITQPDVKIVNGGCEWRMKSL